MPDILPSSLQEILGRRGRIPFVEYCDLVLYHPGDGYYRQSSTRVGATREADFQTNLAVKSLFAPLIIEAARTLLDGEALAEYRFVEVAAEPESSLLSDLDSPFASSEVVRLGDPIPSLGGKVILFANEWLDAQPFARMIFEEGSWREAFVEIGSDGNLCESTGELTSGDARSLMTALPEVAPEGYRLDLSPRADAVLADYLASPWKGLFLTLDYGSSWEALTHSLPAGTGRAYFRHQQEGNLLARPGKQDLTCNVCWDRVAAVLEEAGFSVGGPQRQEAFLLEKAADSIREIVEGGASAEAGARRARLMQLLNPVHFGAAFQVMWGRRGLAAS